ncbi:MAG: hypothetical protein K2H84_02095 [Paramuribaculum sp.]|nr:hypothetical protein [Paramuribaculum sp.]
MDDTFEPFFTELTCESGKVAELLRGGLRLKDVSNYISELNFVAAYDLCRELVMEMVRDGKEFEVIRAIDLINLVLNKKGEEKSELADLRAALLHIKTRILIYQGKPDDALQAAAECLNLLAQNVKRRDESFLSVLAAILYDIARLNINRGKYRQAEREIEKSAKIYERLARISPQRYGSAHILAVAAATKTNISKVKQAEMLAVLHKSSDDYMREVNAGVENAAVRLVESLEQEGTTLMQMGREREAVQYFTRSLKYLTKIEGEFSEKQLELSVELGEALLGVKAAREKGIHLLNTMLHKASRLGADEIHKKIVDILYNAGNRGADILGFWHKIFPR